MDKTGRQITKIAREVNRFTVRTLKLEGVGTSEYDLIHVVRKNPGITQAGIRQILGIDKGATARRTQNLIAKGYLEGRKDPADKRCRRLYATGQADRLKLSKAAAEAAYYDWLLEGLTEEEITQFLPLLDKIYQRSKQESKASFADLTERAAAK